MKKFKFLCVTFLLLVAIMLVLSSCSSKEEILSSDITSVEVKGSESKREVRIEAEFTAEDLEQYDGQKIYLIAKDMTDSDATYKAVDSAKIKSRMKFEVPFESNGKTHLNTAFVCAVAEGEGESMHFTPITGEKYITNVSDLGDKVSRPSTSSIKGLATTNIGHADYLGVQHILLEVRLDSILLEKYEEGAESVTSEGLTYYFDGKYVENLDKKIKQATDSGARVYLQFMLKDPKADEGVDDKDKKDRIDCLYFSGALAQSPEAFLPDLSDKQTLGYLTALFDFIADRYSGGEHGVAIDYIIGKNCNSSNWCNAGKADSGEAFQYYVSYVRLAYNCLVSRVSNGNVYASFNESWTGASSNGSYGKILSFASEALATGDFGWSIAMSYGDIASDTVWGSGEQYGNTFTSDNLAELSGLCESLKYKNSSRSVIISSFSLKENTGSETGAQKRGASYAYMYYKTADSGIVDALIYSIYDSDMRGLINTINEETSLCDSFKICGSSRVSELDKYATVVGEKWYSIKESDSFDKVSVYYASPKEGINNKNPKRFFDFTSGSTCGFVPVGGADYAGLFEYTGTNGGTGTYLLSGGAASNTEDEWRVIFCEKLEKTEIKSSKYLGITMCSQYSGENITVIITGEAKKTGEKISLVATAKVGGTPKEYFFDISSFADKLASKDVSISICSPQMSGVEYGELAVYRASLYGSSGTQIWIYVLIAVIIVLVAVGLILTVRILDKRSRRKSSSGKKKSSGGGKKQSVKKKPEPNDEIIDDDDEDGGDEITEDDEDDEIYDLDDEDGE